MKKILSSINIAEIRNTNIAPEGEYAVYQHKFSSGDNVQQVIWPRQIFEALKGLKDLSPIYFFRCAYNVKKVTPWYADSPKSALESFLKANYSKLNNKPYFAEGYFIVESLVEGEYYIIIETRQDVGDSDERF